MTSAPPWCCGNYSPHKTRRYLSGQNRKHRNFVARDYACFYVLIVMSSLRPLNILLAEDEQSVAFSISFALKADGHRIEIAADGEQALSKLTEEPDAFDLLITDNNMPRMTGVELVTRLRETPFSGKILVLSAHLSPEKRAAYCALRVHGMMPKPPLIFTNCELWLEDWEATSQRFFRASFSYRGEGRSTSSSWDWSRMTPKN